MVRQFSAGGVIFKNSKVMLVKNSSIKDRKISFWGFPKGHLEEGEKSADAALREVEEETGIKAKIVGKVDQSKYFFTQGGERIFKIVTVFLMEYQSGKAKPQQAEIDEVVWMSSDEAMDKLTFDNDKDLLKAALKLKNG